jgi:hypothetical protein
MVTSIWNTLPVPLDQPRELVKAAIGDWVEYGVVW